MTIMCFFFVFVNIIMKTSYSLLDSGDQSKLECFGDVVISRPCSVAVWRPKLSKGDWDCADGCFCREPRNCWSWRKKIPDEWVVELEGFRFKLSPTDFGHVGVFPEHCECWRWMEDLLGKTYDRFVRKKRPCEVLNLFAYSGAATLAAARAGAHVCHLDASRGMVAWGRENAALNGLERAPIRWIVDDAKKFLQRELRRGRRYDGVILDPPSFGRGKRGEVFKIEEDLPEMLELCRQLLSEEPLFVLVSCHTPGFTPMVMRNLLEQTIPSEGGCIDQGELLLGRENAPNSVPSGTFARIGWADG